MARPAERLLSPRLMLCPVSAGELATAGAGFGFAADPMPEDLTDGWLIERQSDRCVVGIVAATKSLTCVVDATCRRRGYAGEALARLALEESLPQRLKRPDSPAAQGLLAKIGYRPDRDPRTLVGTELATCASAIRRGWNADYRRRIDDHCQRLGIPSDYAERHRLEPIAPAERLRSIGRDRFDREQFLAPPAAGAWERLRAAATADGVALEALSGYRALDYQADLIERKLKRGDPIEDVLKVSAAPGYSQHHSGLALDVGTPDSPPLEETFETTAAFAWLTNRAAEFDFRMSYPRDNPHGIAYEPWHWAWSQTHITKSL